ncbi:MAG: alpha/beta hydrolase family protein [Actinomycetota bacterium]
MAKQLQIETERGTVSALLSGEEAGRPILVLGPGAGAALDHPLLAGCAERLAEDGVACLRFNFLYREQGRKTPDPEKVLRDVGRAVFVKARDLGEPVWVGGKSLGGRIASMLVADGMPAAGLVFLGYPLHPPGKPERMRDAHLADIRVPMLFIQGTRDPFARWDLLQATLKRLGELATLHAVDGGDHSLRLRGKPEPDEAIGRRLGEIAARFVARRSTGSAPPG